jgi:hypothetical protein
MKRSIAAALAAFVVLAGDADAQAVYRCVEKGKPVSFQTDPCAAAATVSKIREFTPDRELTAYERQQRAAQWATRPTPQASAHQHGTAAVVNTRSSQPGHTCAQAKADRDRWERTVGLKRSYDAIRAMNDMVARACN